MPHVLGGGSGGEYRPTPCCSEGGGDGEPGGRRPKVVVKVKETTGDLSPSPVTQGKTRIRAPKPKIPKPKVKYRQMVRMPDIAPTLGIWGGTYGGESDEASYKIGLHIRRVFETTIEEGQPGLASGSGTTNASCLLSTPTWTALALAHFPMALVDQGRRYSVLKGLAMED